MKRTGQVSAPRRPAVGPNEIHSQIMSANADYRAVPKGILSPYPGLCGARPGDRTRHNPSDYQQLRAHAIRLEPPGTGRTLGHTGHTVRRSAPLPESSPRRKVASPQDFLRTVNLTVIFTLGVREVAA